MNEVLKFSDIVKKFNEWKPATERKLTRATAIRVHAEAMVKLRRALKEMEWDDEQG
ncbi:hypothetical protein N9878_01315 [bacterium]|nr:hypothetical protein [bacterium]